MKNVKRIFAALLAILTLTAAALPVFAAVPNFKNDSLKLTYTNEEEGGYTMPYRLYIPKDYDEGKSYPVLFFLHGAGERGNDNENQLTNALPILAKVSPDLISEMIVVAPQCPANEQWVDADWSKGNYSIEKYPETKALKTAMKILDKTLSEYNCDTDRLYVMGLSMGGYGTWDVLARHGERFAAGIPLCGGGDPSQAEILKEIPIWTYHGDADTTVKFSGTKEMVEAIEAAGGEKIIFTPVAGAGHNIWNTAAGNKELLPWLLSNKLSDRMPEVPDEPDVPQENDPVTENKTEKKNETGKTVALIGAAAAVGAAVIVVFANTARKKSPKI